MVFEENRDKLDNEWYWQWFFGFDIKSKDNEIINMWESSNKKASVQQKKLPTNSKCNL